MKRNGPQKEPGKEFSHISTATPARPDIFYIVLDEYAGTRVLKEHFHYDNSQFLQFLLERRFFVAGNPSSNYSYTPFSMAATFDMDYPVWINEKKTIRAKDYTIAAEQISNSRGIRFLRQAGYVIKNYSVFDIQDQPSLFDPGFLALKIKLITSKTMLERIRKTIFWGMDIQPGMELNWLGNARTRIGRGNKNLLELTRKAAFDTSGSPRFVYSHLMMPHIPYLYDSTGKEIHSIYTGGSAANPQADYLQYLVYTNKVMAQLIDQIIQQTKGQAVIMLMSDHGYRGIKQSNCETRNCNFNAVYLPAQDYRFFYDSISNVNQFRALFNSLFNQRHAYLKDTCVF